MHLSLNERPHFSVTAEVREPGHKGDKGLVACGAIHDEILAGFPELAPLVAIHFSDDNGVPSNAVANGLCWLGQGDPRYRPRGEAHLDKFARLWRCTEAEAGQALEYVRAAQIGHDGAARQEHATAAMLDLASACLPRWQAEADQALAMIRGQARRPAS